MADPFWGEIRIFSFNFAPKNWAHCDGQILPINQNQALFALLGPWYGGNGQHTFALPDLRGRVPMHRGYSHPLRESAGTDAHTLSVSELPFHVHSLPASRRPALERSPKKAAAAMVPAQARDDVYGPPSAQPVPLGTYTASTGGSQPHENRQPFLALNFCIALQGIFPTRD